MSSQWCWCVCWLRLRPARQCPVSGVGVFAGSFSALLHIVKLVVLVCLHAPSTPCYTVSSQWCWCVCGFRLRHATQCPVSGVGVFACSVYALFHSVQSVVVLVCLQVPSTPCYIVSSQWCWCVCWLSLRPATQCPVGGVGVFAGSVYALLHSVQSVVLMCLHATSTPCYTVVMVCLLAPSTPCYTVSSQWSWCVCRLRMRPATQCTVSCVDVFACSVYALLPRVH